MPAFDTRPASERAGPDSVAAGKTTSGSRYKVATRPATVGTTWLDMFRPGSCGLGLEARIRVVADVAGALVQIHDNAGLPGAHRRHGRVTPRHVLVGVDGTSSLFTTPEPFARLLPPQPDLGYLAPEILDQSGEADARSDVFGLGVLLWEALDNGRLFPHRRAAAISRLISRRALPDPRVDQAWARPLEAVASRALALAPERRYQNATDFWLALREHLPAPEEARAALAAAAQRALKLELTADVRDVPPYVNGAAASSRTAIVSDRSSERPVAGRLQSARRYSLRPTSDEAGPLSAGPPESGIATRRRTPDTVSQPALSTLSSSTPFGDLGEAATLEMQPPDSPGEVHARPSEAEEPATERSEPPATAAERATTAERATAAEPSPVSTLRVSIPPGLVDSSLPYYLSHPAPPKPFPWGMLSFAAMVFFGVGAVVALLAVTALRGLGSTAPPQSPAPLAPSTPTAHVPDPAPPLSSGRADRASAPTAETAPPSRAQASPELAPAIQPLDAREAAPPPVVARRDPSTGRSATPSATPSAKPSATPRSKPAPKRAKRSTDLPFTEQPY